MSQTGGLPTPNNILSDTYCFGWANPQFGTPKKSGFQDTAQNNRCPKVCGLGWANPRFGTPKQKVVFILFQSGQKDSGRGGGGEGGGEELILDSSENSTITRELAGGGEGGNLWTQPSGITCHRIPLCDPVYTSTWSYQFTRTNIGSDIF